MSPSALGCAAVDGARAGLSELERGDCLTTYLDYSRQDWVSGSSEARGSDCSRIFGLRVERQALRAMMECARGEPIGFNGLSRPRLLSACPRVGQNRCAIT